MLTALSIQNYALIDTLQVDFNSGLSIITGETGAGKSILLGGLSLILGKRADLSALRVPTEKCIIEAVFNIEAYTLERLFLKLDLDYDVQTIIRREILPSGKSRAFVNDTPVTLNNLQILTGELIDIHSQNETLQLTEVDFQFKIIDALAACQLDKEKYSKYLKDYKHLKQEIEDLQIFKAEAVKEQDYNQFLLSELEDVKLQPDELERLEAEHATLENIETIRHELGVANQLLSDEHRGVLLNLTQIKQALQRVSSWAKPYEALLRRTESVFIELDDVTNEISVLEHDLEADPTRLETVNLRLQTIERLFAKHQVNSIQALLNIEASLAETVLKTTQVDQTLTEKETQLKTLQNHLDSVAKKIHDKRSKAIPKLKQKLGLILADLGMPNAQFAIEAQLTTEYYLNGKDTIQFLFSANKGGQFNTLKKAASGGELSRIMLAIKTILSEYVKLPTIIFDEIDTGVSGEISHKMGDIMLKMSTSMQVITITHLPQIAAKGHSHFKVYKQEKQEQTQTNMELLNAERRVEEIAKMLGGAELSSSAIAHAKELLN